LQSRGVVFLTCHTAVMEQSKSLIKGGFAPSGMTAKDVAADILTHLIPGAIVVPSGVATVAVLQQVYRYTYITIQS
ncbi:MAG: transcriptional initiation protein Tat, partial [Vulcanimicrobiaceae bacterium]